MLGQTVQRRRQCRIVVWYLRYQRCQRRHRTLHPGIVRLRRGVSHQRIQLSPKISNARCLLLDYPVCQFSIDARACFVERDGIGKQGECPLNRYSTGVPITCSPVANGDGGDRKALRHEIGRRAQ
jgi:hypothetical protein